MYCMVYTAVYEELVEMRRACGTRAHLKAILGVGELGNASNIYRASWVSMLAGAHCPLTCPPTCPPTLPLRYAHDTTHHSVHSQVLLYSTADFEYCTVRSVLLYIVCVCVCVLV